MRELEHFPMLLNMKQTGRSRPAFAWRRVSAITVAVIVFAAIAAHPARADDPNAVVATVGDHKISNKDLDAKVKPQLDQMRASLEKRVDQMIADKTFDLRRQTLEAMTDDYLVQQAAQRDKLSVNDYLKQESTGKSGVTEADAKKFYDQHKGPNTPPFAALKPQVMEMMNREALLERLRKDQPVKILLAPQRVVVDSSGHPSQGAKDAPVTIVEFTDFQCPFCERTQGTLKELQTKYGDKIRIVHMDFPLPFHQHALDAAKAARCANEQGKFWPYRDALFANQSKLAPADLKAAAKNLGLNTTEFDTCFASSKFDSQIKADQAAGEKVGVDGTPAFFVDGRPLTGAQPASQFEQLIDDELATGGANKQASAK
jgi:protein-disulfide isomerase